MKFKLMFLAFCGLLSTENTALAFDPPRILSVLHGRQVRVCSGTTMFAPVIGMETPLMI